MNVVSVVGRLTKDPVISYLESGKIVTKGGIAVTNPFKKNEDGKASADFLDFEVWGKAGEILAEYVRKGHQVGLDGRFKQDSWEAEDGTKRSKVLLNVEHVHLLNNDRGDV